MYLFTLEERKTSVQGSISNQYQCKCQREGEGQEGSAAAGEAGLLFKCKHLQRGSRISSEL